MKNKLLSLLTFTLFSGVALATDYDNTLNSIPSLRIPNIATYTGTIQGKGEVCIIGNKEGKTRGGELYAVLHSTNVNADMTLILLRNVGGNGWGEIKRNDIDKPLKYEDYYTSGLSWIWKIKNNSSETSNYSLDATVHDDKEDSDVLTKCPV
ncbi:MULTISPECIES: superantigen YpM [Yersinia pseudotuberculosis complex]|uniref:-derived mitogen n=5 Tax=Yersinia pseudotuberculosis TaxID=633 RepID=Q57221_YERPU|nr:MULTISPECIES: superantigen YpM [Yersinia pseudotuberculosis complex]AAK28542.1 superantigen YPMa [Yersinia pseudotuberculosis]ABS46381.1 superantigen YpmA [Yersinia pseudotuberculosis IP 31758]AJK17938.1 derived mitogen [Yersinia pseudotuberculosis str. PA3606]MCE4110809.1 superantigen YpM [Yersinia pseudotuberculosis]MCF1162059.1 superantigen YpM [Yersinia pseudotuberculosis]